jgi:hypothetical protein
MALPVSERGDARPLGQGSVLENPLSAIFLNKIEFCSSVARHYKRKLTTVFWDVAPFSLVKVNQRFRGVCCLHHHGNDN